MQLNEKYKTGILKIINNLFFAYLLDLYFALKIAKCTWRQVPRKPGSTPRFAERMLGLGV